MRLYFRLVDDVAFVHNRPGKGDASITLTQSDSPGAALDKGGSTMSMIALFIVRKNLRPVVHGL